MLIQSQNAFFENLQRSAQNTSPSKPAGSDSSLSDTSSQRVGFAHSPKTSLNQAENSLGKGGLKAIFSSGSVYQGLSTLAEARNTGPTTVQPVSATEALAEGGEIPPIPDPQNVAACKQFIQAHQITVDDLLSVLNTQEIPVRQTGEKLDFQTGYQNLRDLTQTAIQTAYPVSASTSGVSATTVQPDPTACKKSQVLYSLLKHSFALADSKFSPRPVDWNEQKLSELVWFDNKHLSNLKTACTAFKENKATDEQKYMVNAILNEVQNHPCDFLRETVNQGPFQQNRVLSEQIKGQIKQETTENKSEFVSAPCSQQIAQYLYQSQYRVNKTASAMFQTSLQKLPTIEDAAEFGIPLSIEKNAFSVGNVAISIEKNKKAADLIAENHLPNAEQLATAFYNLSQPLCLNYACHIKEIVWPQNQILDNPKKLNFLHTETTGRGEAAKSSLEVSMYSDNYRLATRQEIFFKNLVHEVGHVFCDVAFTKPEDWPQWQAAMTQDNFKSDNLLEPVESHPSAVTKYAQHDENWLREDLAETLTLYVLSAQTQTQDVYRAAFPHRFAIMDQFADKLLTPAQIEKYLPARK